MFKIFKTIIYLKNINKNNLSYIMYHDLKLKEIYSLSIIYKVEKYKKCYGFYYNSTIILFYLLLNI